MEHLGSLIIFLARHMGVVWTISLALIAQLAAAITLGAPARRLRVGLVVACAILSLAWAGVFGVAFGPMRPLWTTTRQIARHLGQPLPEMRFHRVDDGSESALSHLRGHVVVLDLWWTHCGGCRRQLPDLDRLQRELRPRGVVVVTLSDEPREQLREVVSASSPAALNGYIDSFGWLDSVSDFRPLTVFIDRDGLVRDFAFGAHGYEALVERSLPLL